MILKQRKYNCPVATGDELVLSWDQYGDVTARQIIPSKTKEVQMKWERLQGLAEFRAAKLNNILDTMTQLEKSIFEIRAWLTQIEGQLGRPLISEAFLKESFNHKMQEHDK
ncbi:hypothetical protein WA026_019296 [Henosepilachna vigintioctopunctata]|uniref:Uncharacterized protein n=1 Tax=Henosepilachna vigintioctopunctata TaxID=420089 RepID=A0AAW1UA91_9CUCU